MIAGNEIYIVITSLAQDYRTYIVSLHAIIKFKNGPMPYTSFFKTHCDIEQNFQVDIVNSGKGKPPLWI